jgi:hypothetical protein
MRPAVLFVTGITGSPDFPTTPDAFQRTFGGGAVYAFVIQLNPTGTALVYSTFLGGADSDYGSSIALDARASVYFNGTPYSRNFPTTPGAFHTAYAGGSSDAFLIRIRSESAPTSLRVTSSASSAAFGQPVTFSATVSPAVAAGTVQFGVDGHCLGEPLTVAGGTATSAPISS